MKAPCKDCHDRHTACHDTCEKFAEYKADEEKKRAYNRQDTEYFYYRKERSKRLHKQRKET